jgi:predicted dehydrogenase
MIDKRRGNVAQTFLSAGSQDFPVPGSGARRSRRTFLKGCAVASAAVAVPARLWSQVEGANNDIRIAVVGFNGRGKGHIESFSKIKGVRLVALCDVDRDVLRVAAERLRNGGQAVETFVDVRKLLEQKDIDAISIATPNHWHALMSIWACQAGKDVYVEKPVSHNVWEGRKIVEAARKYKRIVQTGTQSRSSAAWREALEWVRNGKLGKIKLARGLCYKRRDSIGKVFGPEPVPALVDYDLWCGPAPKIPLMRKNLHYDWHWVWLTGNGDLGNQGIHEMDLCRWALGKNALSPRILSVGGRFGYNDDGETPNTQFVVHDYGDALIVFEVRGLPTFRGSKEMDEYRGQKIGVVIECENGHLAGTTAYDDKGEIIKKFSGGGVDHIENFITAVRSRKTSDLNADILEGHLSSALCHTGNISYRLGAKANPDEIYAALKTDAAATETMERMERHLVTNGITLRSQKAALGVFLRMDPKTETFIDNPLANEMLRRNCREPFVVPEKV